MPSAEQVYVFRHALVRDAAYALHLPSERCSLHVLAIDSLAATGEQQDAIAGQLAEHAMLALKDAEPAQRAPLQEAEKRYRQQAADYAQSRDSSAEYVEHMLRLAELPQPDLRARINCLALGGSTLMGMGHLHRAEATALHMIELAREHDDKVQEARSLRALMAVEATVGKGDQADLHLRQSLDILEQLGDRGELASTLRAFALHTMSRGRYDEARSWIKRALPYSDDNPWERALLLDTRGQLAVLTGNFKEALADYRQSVKICRELANTSKARDTRTGIAGCLVELGRLSEAESEARTLLEEFRKAGRTLDEAAMVSVLASIETRRGRHEEAIALLRQSLSARRQQGAVWHVIEATGNLAEALCEAGKFDEALDFANQTLRLSREQDSLSGMAKAHWLLGWTHEEQGRLHEAEQELTQAARLQEQLREVRRSELVKERLEGVRRKLAGVTGVPPPETPRSP